MSEKLLVTVVVPFYNEAEVIPAFFQELRTALQKAEFDAEIVAVDDGSTDQTFTLLQSEAASTPNLRVVRLSRNFGHQHALMAGLDVASGGAIVTIDGDLQDPPSVISDLVAKFQEGFDVVYAVRASREGEPFLRLLTISLFYRVLYRISRLQVPIDAGDFRLISRRALAEVRLVRDATPYLRGLAAWVGFPQATVRYNRQRRAAGRSKYGLFKLMQLGWNGISALSHVPLRLATHLGLLVSFVSFLLGILLVTAKLLLRVDPPGWTSLITIVLFMGGVQMLMIGILGEYVGRIHDQVKQRPLYVVREKVNVR